MKSFYEGRNKRNPDLNPYWHIQKCIQDIDGERLQWLSGDFIENFNQWEQFVMERPGEFTTKQCNGKKGFNIMFICNKRGTRITALGYTCRPSLMKKSNTLLKL